MVAGGYEHVSRWRADKEAQQTGRTGQARCVLGFLLAERPEWNDELGILKTDYVKWN